MRLSALVSLLLWSILCLAPVISLAPSGTASAASATPSSSPSAPAPILSPVLAPGRGSALPAPSLSGLLLVSPSPVQPNRVVLPQAAPACVCPSPSVTMVDYGDAGSVEVPVWGWCGSVTRIASGFSIVGALTGLGLIKVVWHLEDVYNTSLWTKGWLLFVALLALFVGCVPLGSDIHCMKPAKGLMKAEVIGGLIERVFSLVTSLFSVGSALIKLVQTWKRNLAKEKAGANSARSDDYEPQVVPLDELELDVLATSVDTARDKSTMSKRLSDYDHQGCSSE